MTTTEEVIRLAREAGVRVIIGSKFNRDDYTSVQSSFPALVRLIDLVKAEENEAIIAAANALENIASTSSSTRIRRVANDALTAIRARRNHG